MGEHDENITFERTVEMIGLDLATRIRDLSIAIYKAAAEIALTKGMIIADTKFEFGLAPDGTLVLMDEVLTPDSSRYWPVEGYAAALAAGREPAQLRQAVRARLAGAGQGGRQALGQDGPGATPAAGRDRKDRRQVPRSTGAADGLKRSGPAGHVVTG
jgi:phosphoribosylaminoimidazole-succinocarboxamide synthase